MNLYQKQLDSEFLFFRITGHLFFLILAILSLIFWKERHAFDAAHYLFEIVNREGFYIAHQRPVGIVSQILPLVGSWFGLPLIWLMKLYSIGDILWYYFLFLILERIYKDRAGITWLIAISAFAVLYSFYCPVTELLQGLAILPVFHALLQHPFRFRTVAIIAVLVLIITSHPLLFIPSGFLIAWWHHNHFDRDTLYTASITWISFGIITYLKLTHLDIYDHQKTYYASEFNDYSHVANLKNTAYIFSFLRMLVSEWPLITIIFFISIFQLVILRKWFSIILYLAGIIAFITIIIGTHSFVAITNYSERMLLPLAAMVTLPYAMLCFYGKHKSLRIASYTFLVICVVYRLVVIADASKPYTLRVDQLRSLINVSRAFEIKKAVADENRLEQNSFAMTGWCYPLETLLFSSLQGPDSTLTIALNKEHIERFNNSGRIINSNEWIKTSQDIVPVNSLNTEYFRLDNGEYRSLLSSCKPYPSITIETGKVTDIREDESFLELKIQSEGNKRMCNLDADVAFYVEIGDENQRILRGSMILPETDYPGIYLQYLPFIRPKIEGSFFAYVSARDSSGTIIASDTIPLNY